MTTYNWRKSTLGGDEEFISRGRIAATQRAIPARLRCYYFPIRRRWRPRKRSLSCRHRSFCFISLCSFLPKRNDVRKPRGRVMACHSHRPEDQRENSVALVSRGGQAVSHTRRSEPTGGRAYMWRLLFFDSFSAGPQTERLAFVFQSAVGFWVRESPSCVCTRADVPRKRPAVCAPRFLRA